MASTSPDRQALIEQLRQHLQDAKIRYDFAKTFAKEVRQDFANRSIDYPVEVFGYRQALRAEIEALVECNRLLRTMADLALRGTVPDSAKGGGMLAKACARDSEARVSGIPR